MVKYQLGSGTVQQQMRIIVHSEGAHFDLSAAMSDPTFAQALALAQSDIPASLLHMIQRWSEWQPLLPQVVAHLERDGARYQLDANEIRWLPPLQYPNKLICLGANYKDHNAEMGNNSRSRFPYSFLKPPTTTLIGSGSSITLPEYAKMIDWEVELAIVIGKRAHNISGDEVNACIAGYSVFNDLSVRDWIAEMEKSFMGLDWVTLKGFDGSAPMGPYITPAEFVPDPQALNLSLTLNGVIKQQANTASMVFTIHEIVEHLARVMTLEPGDVIATGTPSGVGFGRKPPEFLQAGDQMVATIEGLGTLENRIQ